MENEENKFTSGQKGSHTRLLNKIKEDAAGVVAELEASHKEVELLRARLLDDGEERSVESQVNEFLQGIDEHYSNIEGLVHEIENYRNKILDSDDGVSLEIESAYESITNIAEETKQLRVKFEASSLLLYGDKDNDKKGIIEELHELFGSYEGSLDLHEKKSEELIHQIEGALAGATNVELAKAFKDQKESYNIPKNVWTAIFMSSIAVMTYFAFGLNKVTGSGSDYLIEIIKRLPLFGPLIWLALFASKQQSQNKRLEQEYAHKETIAKTYVGHKNQIEKLAGSTEKDALVTKLATSTIDAIEFNPSSTLDCKDHKDDMPSGELLKLLKQSIDKLGK